MRFYPRQYSSFVFFASSEIKISSVLPTAPPLFSPRLCASAVNINFDFALPMTRCSDVQMPRFSPCLRVSVVDVVQFFASSFPRAHLKTVELSGEANDSFNQ